MISITATVGPAYTVLATPSAQYVGGVVDTGTILPCTAATAAATAAGAAVGMACFTVPAAAVAADVFVEDAVIHDTAALAAFWDATGSQVGDSESICPGSPASVGQVQIPAGAVYLGVSPAEASLGLQCPAASSPATTGVTVAQFFAA